MNTRIKNKTCYTKWKRTADIVLSAVALLLLSPLFIGISIAIQLDSKGPVIFRQKRVGIHKTHFEILKFRTMYADTSGLVALIAKAHGKKIRLWKSLASFVRLASLTPGRIGRMTDKAFGSFSYEMSLSEYTKGNYRVHDLKQSILVTEKGSQKQ